MKKLHDIIYHFAGTKNSCGTMICNKCKSKIDSLTQDWCHGIKYNLILLKKQKNKKILKIKNY